jgi:preprotein translocase subunit SecA
MSVNDYLACRDAEWMRPIYDLLGVTVGWIGQGSTAAERRRAYAAQVTYAPVSEFGFDMLRDRLVTDTADLVAGDPDVVLVDEADSRTSRLSADHPFRRPGAVPSRARRALLVSTKSGR